MANRYRAEIPAPWFGEGFVLRLDTDGQAQLEDKFGTDDILATLEKKLVAASIHAVRAYVDCALRLPDGKKAPTVTSANWPDVAPRTVALACLESLCQYLDDKSHAQMCDEAEAAASKMMARERVDDPNFLRAVLEVVSRRLETLPSPSESGTANSGK